MSHQILIWVSFNILVLVLLALDLGVFHRKDHEISIKEALVWSVIWTVLGLLFNVLVWWKIGSQKGLEFLNAYIVERTLSMDNLFAFLLIISYFKVSARYQYKVLFWGILVALAMRAAFIVVGVALISRFHWILYLFGAFLVYTGIKMAFQKDQGLEVEKNPVLRLIRRFLPVTEGYVEGKFFVRRNKILFVTPLFVVLMVINTADVIFAFDSIPAIFAITLDPFIVYSANVFSVLGLRALYFALAAMTKFFRYLNYGIALILSFVGAKMLLDTVFPIPTAISLMVVCGLLAMSVIVSVMFPKKEKESA